MNRSKTIGSAIIALSVVVLLIGIFATLLRGDNGLFGALVSSARDVEARQAASNELLSGLQSALRKASAAEGEAINAVSEAQKAADKVQQTYNTLVGVETENELAALYKSLLEAATNLEGSDAEIETVEAYQTLVQGDALPMQRALVNVESAIGDTQNALASIMSSVESLYVTALDQELAYARSASSAALSALADAYASFYQLAESTGIPSFKEESFHLFTPEEGSHLDLLRQESDYLVELSHWLKGQSESLVKKEEALLSGAREERRGITQSFADQMISWLSTYFILIVFTGALLLLIGITFRFYSESFAMLWKKNPVFSTFIALLVLMVVQIYSMKFTYNSFGEWISFWLDNTFNVFRANTSVGMIALGMTMVIITGGIDLAVGSTLSGVGTVVMMLIDTSPRGILGRMGISGTPALLLGVLGGFFAGALIGALIGLAVTKGKVPPFIITLGVMNIVRSLSQFVTKSYTPKVPTEFTKIANTIVFGQRLLPIVYWLVLAFVFYVFMKRTRFGRYIYAVGSNERTTRLSGINVERVKFFVYTVMGILVSVASVTQVSRLGGMDAASAGSGYELDAIAAVVVGGTSMSGGRGSIAGTVIGVLIIGVMNNLLILLGVDSFLTNAFKGAIVVVAVLMQRKDQGGI